MIHLPCSLNRSRRILQFLLALCLWLTAAPVQTSGAAPELLDDRAITVHSARQITAKRRALVHHLWGESGFPKNRRPDAVLTNVPSPVQFLPNLRQVDEFRFRLAPGLEGLAYHFAPRTPNRHLVVVHHGHACTLDDDPSPQNAGYGLQRTIAALLREGYAVLGSSCRGCAREIASGNTTRCLTRQRRAAPFDISWSPWRRA